MTQENTLAKYFLEAAAELNFVRGELARLEARKKELITKLKICAERQLHDKPDCLLVMALDPVQFAHFLAASPNNYDFSKFVDFSPAAISVPNLEKQN